MASSPSEENPLCVNYPLPDHPNPLHINGLRAQQLIYTYPHGKIHMSKLPRLERAVTSKGQGPAIRGAPFHSTEAEGESANGSHGYTTP